MQCFSPYMVQNKYTNIHGLNKVTPVPCGQCINCKKRRSRNWVFRLEQETKVSSSVSFLTLTYADEHLPKSENGFATLVKKDFQLFMKKLRIECPTSKKQNRIKYFAVGEYGEKKDRPHYHAVLFNVPHQLIRDPLKIDKTWDKGIIQLEYPRNNAKTTNYVTGYITKQTFERRDYINTNTGLITTDDRLKEFSLMSKGMGINYLTPQMKQYFRNTKTFVIVKENGELVSMPRYYKNKIFTQKELTEMYHEYINIIDTDIEEQINNIGEAYFKNQRDQIFALIRKTEKENKLKRLQCN